MSATAVTPQHLAGSRWLRSMPFDYSLLGGTTTLAILAGLAVAWRPTLLPMLVALDALLLGRQHVLATYTRLAGDAELRRNLLMTLWLPCAVLAVVSATYLVGGARALTTIYLYWQWFHYVRQGHGVERIHARAAGQPRRDRLTDAVIYLMPLWGVLSWSHLGWRQGSTFLGQPVWWAPIPGVVVHAVSFAALLALALWLVRGLTQERGGPSSLWSARGFYVCSHTLIFVVAYIVLPSVDAGWLVVNVWHNAQYVLIVWLFNTSPVRRREYSGRALIS